MKGKITAILICFAWLLFFPCEAAAHFLVTDKNVGAVLHVDPNDDPVAGGQSSFFFEIKDRENKFQPENCDCTFLIKENGIEIFSQPLFQNNTSPSLNNASVIYTFPKRDVYQIIVTGKPIVSGQFQSFSLAWDFRIDQVATAQQSSIQKDNFFTTQITHFLGIGIGVLILVLMFVFQIVRKRKLERG